MPQFDPLNPSGFNTFIDLISHRAQTTPDLPVYNFAAKGGAEDRVTFRDLETRACALAIELREITVPGDRVVIALEPGVEFIVAFYAALYAGCIATPAQPPAAAKENRAFRRLRNILMDARPAAVICGAALRNCYSEVYPHDFATLAIQWIQPRSCGEASGLYTRPGIVRESIAVLQYTSGSTGTPQGVMLSHENLLANARQIYRAFAHTPESIGVIWLPPYHDMGLIGGILQPAYGGFPVHLMSPVQFMQNPLGWLKSISDHRATTSGGPNFAYELCVRKFLSGRNEEVNLASWQIAFNGAENVDAGTMERFAETFAARGFSPKAFRPCYGLAESTLMVTALEGEQGTIALEVEASALRQLGKAEFARSEATSKRIVNCGRVDGRDPAVLIVNNGEAVAERVVGEIWISGKSVAAGYWNKPTPTSDTFEASLSAFPGRKFLRTGDLGFVHAGDLFVTGRMKEVIIIRGVNYYPHDIETASRSSHAALEGRPCAAFAIEDGAEERVGIVQEVGRRHGDGEILKEILGAIERNVLDQTGLACRTIALVLEGSLPKTLSGKIQRLLCGELLSSGKLTILGERSDRSREDAPTHSHAQVPSYSHRCTSETIEDVQAIILREVARLKRRAEADLSPDCSLASVGVDSLQTLQLKATLDRELNIDIALSEVLLMESLGELSAYCVKLMLDGNVFPNPTPSSNPNLETEVSAGQRALWFLHELVPNEIAYNLYGALAFDSRLNEDALAGAIRHLHCRHPILSSRFEEKELHLRRIIGSADSDVLECTDALGWSSQQLHEALARECSQPFDLRSGPVFRCKRWRAPGGRTVVMFVFHHIIADFRSVDVLLDELRSFYMVLESGGSLGSEPLPRQYGEFVQWQRQLLSGPSGTLQRDFWMREIGRGFAKLSFPKDFPAPVRTDYSGEALERVLDAGCSGRLQAIAAALGRTPYSVLLTVLQILGQRFSGLDQFVIGTPTSGRSDSKFLDVIGYCVNPLPICLDASECVTFEQLWSRAALKVKEALANQDYPYPLIVEEARRIKAAEGALFDVVFVYQKALRGSFSASCIAPQPGEQIPFGRTAAEPVALPVVAAQFPIVLAAIERDGQFYFSWQYQTAFYKRETIENFAVIFENILLAVTGDSNVRLDEIPFVLPTQRDEIVARCVGALTPASGYRRLDSWLRDSCVRYGDRVAVVQGDRKLTYRQLWSCVSAVSRLIEGVGQGKHVAVSLPRSLEMIVAVIATINSGNAYVPLDPVLPVERKDLVLRRACVSLILSDKSDPGGPISSILVDLSGREEQVSNQLPGPSPSDEPLLYLIPTSGSTGVPKVAGVFHAGFINLLEWYIQEFEISSEDRILLVSSLSFDLTQKNIFAPLLCGGELVLDDSPHFEPDQIIQRIERSRVTLLNCAPSAFYALVDAAAKEGYRSLKSLRLVFLGGEPIVVERLKPWLRSGSCHADLVNTYGPTECTDITTWSRLSREDLMDRLTAPIGRPIQNCSVAVIGQNGDLVPYGAPGELWIAGAGVGAGYLGDPEMTSKSFVHRSVVPGAPVQLFYRTGDIVRLLPDGNLDYLGRRDSQVKLRGFRIELEEIQRALNEQVNVADSVVLLRDSQSGPELAAWIVQKDPNVPLSPSEMRFALNRQLPDYMIPTSYFGVDRFPVGPNGKIDRAKLVEMSAHLSVCSASHEPPKTDLEKSLVEIWEEVFGRSGIGIHDNFFELGGHSLMITRVAARIQEITGISLPMSQFFRGPTIAQLAISILECQSAGRDQAELTELLNNLDDMSEEELQQALAEKAVG